MKIAILTLPLHTNYGGILQAYALQTVLQRMGHEAEVLQKIPTSAHPTWQMPLVYAKRIALKILKNHKIDIFAEKKWAKEKLIQERNTSKFINKHLNLRCIKSLRSISSTDYDAIIVGSDQIWRAVYFKNMWQANLADAFLGFTEGWNNIIRVSYAPSFGKSNINEYTKNEKEACRMALQKFDAVSVREDSGIRICHDAFDVDAEQVLDPTLLLTKEDYEKIVVENKVKKSTGNLLCYILDNSDFKLAVVREVSEKKNLTPFFVSSDVDNKDIPIENRVQPPLESWLRGFMDAECIVTDSFHACVFSIIFRKPFIVIGNKDRGLTRVNSLLKIFNLEENLIIEDMTVSISGNLGKQPADIGQILDKERMRSIDFLKKYLLS